MNYTTHTVSWEKYATIRTRPRRILEDDNFNYYPEERQMLCFDPIITKLDPSIKEFILLQSLYKYMNDVIIFETEIVNKTAMNIAKGRFLFNFPFDARYDAMSVVVDEDYHALVAMDYKQQIVKKTGIIPFQIKNEIELSRAIPRAVMNLKDKHKAGMELIAVAISENTITSDVAAFSKDNSIKRSIKGLMADHLADEGRHSKFWIEMVKMYWKGIDEDARVAIGKSLPTFLDEYLTNEIQQEFDTALVNQLDLPQIVRNKIISGIVKSYPVTENHPMISNIRKFFISSGLLDHTPTKIMLNKYIKG